ncbi:MAG: thioredoxin domain-containing protein [Anaeromyxobacteraceae bacterium]
MHALALALLLATGPAPSAPAAPAPATDPLPPGVALGPEAPVISLDGDVILHRELPAGVRALADAFPSRRAAAREAAVRRAVTNALLGLEARRRGVTLRALWEEEVFRKVGPATFDELAARLARTPRLAGKKLEDVRGQLEGMVLLGKLEAREAELARGLETAFPVRPASPPALAGDADDVIVHLGDAALRRRDLAGALAVADSKAVLELLSDRWEAASAVVDERLVRGTAARLRVTAEVLRKDPAAMARLQEGHRVKFLLPIPQGAGWTPELEGSPARGPADAKVTVVEYADFQCPYCGRSWPTVHEALDGYRERVRWVFRNVPMPAHEHALLAAEAGLAAHAQGRFFELADRLFANPAELGLEGLLRHARKAGLDVDRLSRELSEGRWRAEVLWQRREAFSQGLEGTPTLLVNGKPVPPDPGGLTVEALRKAVEAALAEK